MNDTTTIKAYGIPNNRGVDRQTRAARARAARCYRPRSIIRQAIMGGQWDGGAIVGGFRRSEDAIEAVGKNDALIRRLENMLVFCEGTISGDKRPHPANVAQLCRDVLKMFAT